MRLINLRLLVMFAAVLMSIMNLTADEWPKKGDTVYVAVELRTIAPRGFSAFGFNLETYILEPCIPVTVKKARLRKRTPKLDLVDQIGVVFLLEKDWSSRLFRSHPECQEAYEKLPVPKVTSAAWGNHRLSVEEPPTREAESQPTSSQAE